MPFQRNRGPPPNIEKHEIVFTTLGINAAADQSITVAQAVDASSKNLSQEVLIGSRITRLYMEINVAAETVTSAKTLEWLIFKAPFGTTIPAPSLYNQTSKRFVIQRGMEMLPKDVGTVFKRIISIKIPKRYQRMGDNDFLIFKYICSSSETINVCGFFIYKEIN